MQKFVKDDPELLLGTEFGDLQPLADRTNMMWLLMVEHNDLQAAELIGSLSSLGTDAVNPIQQVREVLARVSPEVQGEVVMNALDASQQHSLLPQLFEAMGYDAKLNMLLELLTAMPKQLATTMVSGLLLKLDEVGDSEWFAEMEKLLHGQLDERKQMEHMMHRISCCSYGQVTEGMQTIVKEMWPVEQSKPLVLCLLGGINRREQQWVLESWLRAMGQDERRQMLTAILGRTKDKDLSKVFNEILAKKTAMELIRDKITNTDWLKLIFQDSTGGLAGAV
eukprot:4386511-Prymnesium_polylepis.1